MFTMFALAMGCVTWRRLGRGEGIAGADAKGAKGGRGGAAEEKAASRIGATAGAPDAAPGEGTSGLSIRQAKPNEILHCKCSGPARGVNLGSFI